MEFDTLHIRVPVKTCGACNARLPVEASVLERRSLDPQNPNWQVRSSSAGRGTATLFIHRTDGVDVILDLCEPCGEKARQAVQ